MRAAVSSLTPEERHQVYTMLRLKVIAHLGGDVELAGDLVCIPDGGKVEEGDLVEERSKAETTRSPSTSIQLVPCARRSA